MYSDCKQRVLNGIGDNLERKPVSELDEEAQKQAANLSEKITVKSTESDSDTENFEVRVYVTFALKCVIEKRSRSGIGNQVLIYTFVQHSFKL